MDFEEFADEAIEIFKDLDKEIEELNKKLDIIINIIANAKEIIK